MAKKLIFTTFFVLFVLFVPFGTGHTKPSKTDKTGNKFKDVVTITMKNYFDCMRAQKGSHENFSPELIEAAQLKCEPQFSDHQKALNNFFLFEAEKAINGTKNSAFEMFY